MGDIVFEDQNEIGGIIKSVQAQTITPPDVGKGMKEFMFSTMIRKHKFFSL